MTKDRRKLCDDNDVSLQIIQPKSIKSKLKLVHKISLQTVSFPHYLKFICTIGSATSNGLGRKLQQNHEEDDNCIYIYMQSQKLTVAETIHTHSHAHIYMHMNVLIVRVPKWTMISMVMAWLQSQAPSSTSKKKNSHQTLKN